MAKLIATCWRDVPFRAALIDDPLPILEKMRFRLTDGMIVEVVEDTPKIWHLALPSPPWVIPTHLTLFPYLEDDVPERQRRLGELLVQVWEDPGLKARLMENPEAVLTDAGITVDDGTAVKVLENTANKIYLALPVPPAAFFSSPDEESAESMAEPIVIGVLRSRIY